MPEIYFTRHKQDGQFIRKKEDIATDRLSNKLQTTMNGWREDGCSSIHGAMDWSKDENPHGRENMEIVLAKYR